MGAFATHYWILLQRKQSSQLYELAKKTMAQNGEVSFVQRVASEPDRVKYTAVPLFNGADVISSPRV